MQINSSQPNFCHKIKTINILEATSQKIIESDGIHELRYIIDTFTPIKATGWRGYRYFLKNIGDRIIEKYPEIGNATQDIQAFIRKNPNVKKCELRQYCQKHIDELGETIDIVL